MQIFKTQKKPNAIKIYNEKTPRQYLHQWRSQVGGSGDKPPPLGLEFTLDISKLRRELFLYMKNLNCHPPQKNPGYATGLLFVYVFKSYEFQYLKDT